MAKKVVLPYAERHLLCSSSVSRFSFLYEWVAEEAEAEAAAEKEEANKLRTGATEATPEFISDNHLLDSTQSKASKEQHFATLPQRIQSKP